MIDDKNTQGSGCAKCAQLERALTLALEELICSKYGKPNEWGLVSLLAAERTRLMKEAEHGA